MKVLLFLFQLIQTLRAIDKDDPHSGHQFSFSLAPEATSGSNFTIRDNKGKQAQFTFSMNLSLSLLGSVCVSVSVSMSTNSHHNWFNRQGDVHKHSPLCFRFQTTRRES